MEWPIGLDGSYCQRDEKLLPVRGIQQDVSRVSLRPWTPETFYRKRDFSGLAGQLLVYPSATHKSGGVGRTAPSTESKPFRLGTVGTCVQHLFSSWHRRFFAAALMLRASRLQTPPYTHPLTRLLRRIQRSSSRAARSLQSPVTPLCRLVFEPLHVRAV
jgi:hypothetical protein